MSVTSTLYSDMTLSVVDTEAFQTPPGCQMLTGFSSPAAHRDVSQVDDLQRRRRQFLTAAAAAGTSTCRRVF